MITAKPFNPPTLRDFWGLSWWRIYENSKRKFVKGRPLNIKARDAAHACRIISQKNYLSK